MPTYELLPRFVADYARLTPEERADLRRAVDRFVADLRMGAFRKGLPIRAVKGVLSVYELTWAPDGRATWQYGPEVVPGEPHIIWRRVGAHGIFAKP